MDDDPAPVAEWLPELTNMLNGKKPRRMPRLILRMVAGEGGVVMIPKPRWSNAIKRGQDEGQELEEPRAGPQTSGDQR